MKINERDIKYSIARPTKGAAGKTGQWRLGKKPTVNPDKCTSCGKCELFCPDHAIVITDFAKIDYDYCKGCLICRDVCPVEAISVAREW